MCDRLLLRWLSPSYASASASASANTSTNASASASNSATAIASTSRRKEGVESTLSHRDAGGGRGLRATTSC